MAGRMLLAGLLVLVTSGTAAAQVLDIEARYWLADLDGSAKIEGDSIPGTSLDLDGDLDVEDADLLELRLTIGTGLNSKLRFAYTYGEFDGNRTLDQSIEFAGTTFAAGSRVESDIAVHYGRIGWAWQFLAVPGIFKIGPLLEVKGLVVDTSLRGRAAGDAVRESALVPMVFPTVGLMANVTPLDWLEIFAEVSGIPFGDLGHIVDADAGVRVTPLPLLSIFAGYRLLDARIDIDDDVAELTLSGPFLGASVRF